MPSIFPAWNLTEHLYQLPKVGEFIPRPFGVSHQIDTWSLAMAREVEGLFEEFKVKKGDARDLGLESVVIAFEDFMNSENVDGIVDSRTWADGGAHRGQRWIYVALGLIMAKWGWDFVDAGQYQTQAGILLSRVLWASMAYSLMRVRTVSSTVHAYSVLQNVFAGIQKEAPELLQGGEGSHLDQIRVSVDAIRDTHCELKGEPALAPAATKNAKAKTARKKKAGGDA